MPTRLRPGVAEADRSRISSPSPYAPFGSIWMTASSSASVASRRDTVLLGRPVRSAISDTPAGPVPRHRSTANARSTDWTVDTRASVPHRGTLHNRIAERTLAYDRPVDAAEHTSPTPATDGDGPLFHSMVWSTWALFAGLAMMLVGAGLFVTLIGVRAEREGFPTVSIGLIGAGYYFGFLVGSRVTLRALHTVGHIRVYAALGLGAGGDHPRRRAGGAPRARGSCCGSCRAPASPASTWSPSRG